MQAALIHVKHLAGRLRRLLTRSPADTAVVNVDLADRELEQRNLKRLEEVKRRMGNKYLLHPENFKCKESINFR